VEWCRRNGRRNVARTRRTARAFGSNDVGWHAGRCIARVGRPAVVHLAVWSVIGNEPLRVRRRRDQGNNGNNGEARHHCTSRTRIAIWVGLHGNAEACVLSFDHSSAVASSVGGVSKPNALAVLRLITSSNLVVRGHSGPTQQRHTGLGCAGSGCAQFFATCWKQPQAAWVVLSSFP